MVGVPLNYLPTYNYLHLLRATRLLLEYWLGYNRGVDWQGANQHKP